MVREVTVIGQLEFCPDANWVFLPSLYRPAAGAVEMWESGALFLAGFPSPVGSVGNSSLLLEFCTLSTGRHFHGASSQLFRSAATPV
jgi:hypothetical protein